MGGARPTERGRKRSQSSILARLWPLPTSCGHKVHLTLIRLSRRPVHARPGSRRRLISPHPKHPLGCLDLVTGTPPRNEGARQRGIEEGNRHRVVEHPAQPPCPHGPSV